MLRCTLIALAGRVGRDGPVRWATAGGALGQGCPSPPQLRRPEHRMLAARAAADCPELSQTLFRPHSWLSIRNAQVQHDAARSRIPTCTAVNDEDAATRLAWVGNSMVLYNRMPDMLESMLKQDGIRLSQKDVLVGGQRLRGHSLDANVKELLHAEKWDYVVLQDHSSVPGGAEEAPYEDAISALNSFYAARLPTPDTGSVLLFNTWGHRDGTCEDRERHRTAYPSFAEMNEKTCAGYRAYKETLEDAAAGGLDVKIVPVAEAFRRIYLAVQKSGQDPQDPSSLFSRLYALDGYHPSRLGSFLAACVLYGVMTGKSPKDLTFDTRGRTLAIEGFLVARPFVDTNFDEFMKGKLGESMWQPETMTPELVRPLQAFAHSALHPDEEDEQIPLPPVSREVAKISR